MRDIDITVNSEKGKCNFQIASGYISETAVLFEKENIIALVHAKGCVEFYSFSKELLATGEVPAVESGRGVYEQISCEVVGSSIKIGFPIVQWIDNYPNCDGEHDRWDSKIVGYHILTFDCLKNSVVCM